MFQFDTTISLGSVLIAATLGVTLWRLNNNVVRELTELKTKVDAMWIYFVNRFNHVSDSDK